MGPGMFDDMYIGILIFAVVVGLLMIGAEHGITWIYHHLSVSYR